MLLALTAKHSVSLISFLNFETILNLLQSPKISYPPCPCTILILLLYRKKKKKPSERTPTSRHFICKPFCFCISSPLLSSSDNGRRVWFTAKGQWLHTLSHSLSSSSTYLQPVSPLVPSHQYLNISHLHTTTEARAPRARAPQGKPPQWEARAPQWRVVPAHCN